VLPEALQKPLRIVNPQWCRHRDIAAPGGDHLETS
jgi:hypothetical protein